MADSTIPLEYPDYRRFSRAGVDARILEPRVRDAPKVFCPVILRVSVSLGKSRNGIGLSSDDMMEVAESALDLSEDLLIDVFGDDQDSFEVSVRQLLPDGKFSVGQVFTSSVHDVTLAITAVQDSLDDNEESRRSKLSGMLSSDTLADAVYITVPQTWVVPDPEFKPRLSVLPLFPGSAWMQFFKSCWGNVQAATLVFGQDGIGNVGLAVQFREIKAMRQCVLTLVDRYLIHPKEGFGMKMPQVRVVRYSSVAAKKPLPGIATQGGRQIVQQPRFVSEAERTMQSAQAYAGSKEIPLSVSEAFQKILERVEKLDRENQRLLSMLVDEQQDGFIASASRERSPRGKHEESAVPATGLPPWRK